jgi:hypothetical protein
VDPDFEIVLQSIQRDINWCVRRSLAHTRTHGPHQSDVIARSRDPRAALATPRPPASSARPVPLSPPADLARWWSVA